MARQDTIAKITETLETLKENEPTTQLYSGPEGTVEVVIYDLVGADPQVEFRVHREGEHLPQTFSNATIAFVHLFKQTPHVQRDEHRERR